MPLFECVFAPSAHLHDGTHINLVKGCEHSSGVLCLDQALGYRLRRVSVMSRHLEHLLERDREALVKAASSVKWWPSALALVAIGVIYALVSAQLTVGAQYGLLAVTALVVLATGLTRRYGRVSAGRHIALAGMVVIYLFMTRTYIGTAIRAISQDRQIMVLMGVDTKRLYLVTSALGGALAGLAACLLVLQYDVHPFVGLSFGPITFLIVVLGGLGNFIGGFVAAFVFAEIISLGGMFSDLEWGYVLAFGFFIVMMFIRPAGLLARRQ